MERLLPECTTWMLHYERYLWVNNDATGGGTSSEHKEGQSRRSSETRSSSFIRSFRNDEKLNHLRQKLQNWYWLPFLPFLCVSVHITAVWTLWNAFHCNACLMSVVVRRCICLHPRPHYLSSPQAPRTAGFGRPNARQGITKCRTPDLANKCRNPFGVQTAWAQFTSTLFYTLFLKYDGWHQSQNLRHYSHVCTANFRLSIRHVTFFWIQAVYWIWSSKVHLTWCG